MSSNSLYKLAKALRMTEVVLSGDPKRMKRYAINSITAKIVNKIVWSILRRLK